MAQAPGDPRAGQDRLRTWNKWLPQVLILPALLYLFPFYVASLVVLLAFTFFAYVPGGPFLNPSFTLDNYVRLIDPHYAAILGRTMAISAISSVAAVVISYPVAYWLNRSRSKWRSVCLALIILSFFVVPVVRVFAWTLVLGSKGFINFLLVNLHIVDRPIQLMYNNFGVTLVLTHYLLPLTTLTLAASLRRLDPMLEWASQNLGATPTQSFLSIILPLSVPGLLAALTLSFALNISTFTTPIIIGGGRILVLANAVYDSMLVSQNFPLGSALAIVSLVITLVVMGVASRYVMSRLQTAAGA